MCLSKAYVQKGNKKELVMADIASVKVADGKLTLESLFGEKKEINAIIREIDFTASVLKLEVSKEGVPVD